MVACLFHNSASTLYSVGNAAAGMAGAGVASGSTNALLTAGVDPKVAQFLGMGFGFATATLLAGINYKVWDNRIKSGDVGYSRKIFKASEKKPVSVDTEDLIALRNKWQVPKGHTVAVGKTNIKSLEGNVFEGGSPEMRKSAGLPNLDEVMPDRTIKSPFKNPSFTRHAEEGVLNEFDLTVQKAGLKPENVKGELVVRQSNPRGVCNKCTSGLLTPGKKSGIFQQISEKYPNLEIKVISETVPGEKLNGTGSFNLKNGVIEVLD